MALSDMDSTGSASGLAAALDTSTSTRPCASMTCLSSAATSDALPTWHAMPPHLIPLAWSALTASWTVYIRETVYMYASIYVYKRENMYGV